MIVSAVYCFRVALDTNADGVQARNIACWFTPLAPRKTNPSGLEATLTLTSTLDLTVGQVRNYWFRFTDLESV